MDSSGVHAMLRVSIVQAREGMTLAMPVLHPDKPDKTLLRAGVTLTDATIERLRQICCREVWIRFPGMDCVGAFVSPAVQAAHGAVTGHIARAFDRLTREVDPDLSYASYKSAVATLVAKLTENPRANLFIHEMLDSEVNGLRHAGNVALLSVLIGLKLDFYLVTERARLAAQHARDVTALGVGAMFHDIGMLRLDQPIRERWERTRDDADEEWQRHVRIGYRMVYGHLEPAATAVVLNHHQRFDGSGFPVSKNSSGITRVVSGRDIHVFARIVAAADLFDHLRYPVEGAPPVPAVRVLRTMQQAPYRRWIDPVVMMALLNVVPPYAPGSIVRLSTQQWAAVADWDPTAPCRPIVEAMPEGVEDPSRYDGPTDRIDLRHRPDWTVIEAEGQRVAEQNFYPDPKELDLTRLARSMENAAIGMGHA